MDLRTSPGQVYGYVWNQICVWMSADVMWVPLCVVSVQDKEVKELEQILTQLEKYHPTIPDSVTEYYLRKSGFHTTDSRV